jgi:hypothetical protein
MAWGQVPQKFGAKGAICVQYWTQIWKAICQISIIYQYDKEKLKYKLQVKAQHRAVAAVPSETVRDVQPGTC